MHSLLNWCTLGLVDAPECIPLESHGERNGRLHTVRVVVKRETKVTRSQRTTVVLFLRPLYSPTDEIDFSSLKYTYDIPIQNKFFVVVVVGRHQRESNA